MATKIEQTVKGSKKFQSDVEINNDMLLKNFTLNSIDIPKDLVRKTRNIAISGNIRKLYLRRKISISNQYIRKVK